MRVTMHPKISLHFVARIILTVGLGAAVLLNFEAMRRLTGSCRNGDPGQAADAKVTLYWRHRADARSRLTDLRHKANVLDRRKSQFRTNSKDAGINTDRGVELRGYRNSQTVEIAELNIGLSNKDKVDTFYYDHNRLFFIREIVRHFAWSDKIGEFDFATPSRVTESDTGILPSGVVLGGDTPDAPEDSSMSSRRRIASLRALSLKCAVMVRQRPDEVSEREWTTLFDN